MIDKKKLAAIAGVMALIDSEKATSAPTPEHISPVWSNWGRQNTMQYREITQRRIIKRNK